jgi:hypothetical protein
LALYRLGVVCLEFLPLDEPYALLGVGFENAVNDDDVEGGRLVQ